MGWREGVGDKQTPKKRPKSSPDKTSDLGGLRANHSRE